VKLEKGPANRREPNHLRTLLLFGRRVHSSIGGSDWQIGRELARLGHEVAQTWLNDEGRSSSSDLDDSSVGGPTEVITRAPVASVIRDRSGLEMVLPSDSGRKCVSYEGVVIRGTESRTPQGIRFV